MTAASPTARAEIRDVELCGVEVRTQVIGDGAPLVLLHHSTGPTWGELHDRLAASFRLVAVDLPGYGASELPTWLRSTRDVAVLVAQLLGRVADEPVHLVGPGFGGWVAAETATMAQDRLRSLTLIGAAGIRPREGDIYDYMTEAPVDYLRRGFATSGAFEEVFGEGDAPELEALWATARESTARLTWKPWMRSSSLPHLLAGVRTPALVLAGARDAVVPVDCAAQYAERLARARMETIEGAGHLVDLERPAVVAALVTEHAHRD
jgi:pimeloyl-ACP methyl ester carboxylesterase